MPHKIINENIDIHHIVGIQNKKQDCFVNAALQCLFCVPEFVDFFVHQKYFNIKKKHDTF